MIEVIEVKDVDLGYKKTTTYALCCDGVPLVAPSAYLLSVSKNNGERTASTYASRLKSFFSTIEHMSEDVFSYWKTISDRAMSGYIYGVLKQARGLQRTSIDNHCSAISSFYRFAFQYGYIETELKFSFSLDDDFDAVGSLDSISNEMHDQYYNEHDFKKVILGNINAENDFIAERNRLMMKLGYYAGLRSFEVTLNRNLRKEYLQQKLPRKWTPRSESIKIFGKGRKVRSVPFPISLLEDIHNYLWKYESVFGDGNIICKISGTPFLSENPATDIFSTARNKFLAKKEATEQDWLLWKIRSFHKSRKCFATNFVSQCYEDGLDPYIELPQAMGHEDIETTFKYIYFEALLNKRPKILRQLSLERTHLHNQRFMIRSEEQDENS